MQYSSHHLRFMYPDGWSLDEIRSGGEFIVSLQSAHSAFIFVTFFDHPVDSDHIADQALGTMREEYPDLESSPFSGTIAGLPAVGHDVNFFCLDLTSTCWIRAVSSGDETVLVFAQTSDVDLKAGEAAFESVCASMELPRGAAA